MGIKSFFVNMLIDVGVMERPVTVGDGLTAEERVARNTPWEFETNDISEKPRFREGDEIRCEGELVYRVLNVQTREHTRYLVESVSSGARSWEEKLPGKYLRPYSTVIEAEKTSSHSYLVERHDKTRSWIPEYTIINRMQQINDKKLELRKEQTRKSSELFGGL